MSTFIEKVLNKNSTTTKFNSLTKYFNIPSYHEINNGKGNYLLTDKKDFINECVYVTEKIEGVSARIILSTNHLGNADDYLIGNKDSFLFAKGDRIENPLLNIVENVKTIADTIYFLSEKTLKPNSIYCLYCDMFGGSLKGAKQYTSCGKYSIRIVDMLIISQKEVEELLELNDEEIGKWNTNKQIKFQKSEDLKRFCDKYYLETVPVLTVINGNEIPLEAGRMLNWMEKFQKSELCLDKKALGNSAGVVLRTKDNQLVRELWFKDYRRTQKQLSGVK